MPLTPQAAITPLEPPTVDDVAALLRARTKDLSGEELGTFDENTRPTGEEVERLIELAYAEVTGNVGAQLRDPCASLGRALVAIRAAMWVELSYFPEQVRSDRSAYAEYAQQYSDGTTTLVACVEGNAPSDGGETNAGYRFGVLDVHGWTASPYYGAPDVGGAGVGSIVGPAGPEGPPGPAGAPGPATITQTIEYTYNANAAPPPSSGQLRSDADTHAATTHLYASTTSVDGIDVTNYLTVALAVGGMVYVQDKDDATRWARFDVVAPPTSAFVAGYVDVPVVYVRGGLELVAQRVLCTLSHALPA